MVGLTGGIGSGKSTVAAMLERRGCVVIDADQIAREVVEHPEVLGKLAEAFGPEVITADGTLDRAALAARAFVTDELRKQLEAITHPPIGEEFLRRVAEAPPDGIVVHDVPLLVESKRGFEYGGVIVVVAPREVRLARLEQRGIPRDDAERRMDLQATDEERAQVATWIVDNAGDLADLERQIDEIWPELVERAQARPEPEPAPEQAAD
jgi:dephospho-CoA kinase